MVARVSRLHGGAASFELVVTDAHAGSFEGSRSSLSNTHTRVTSGRSGAT